MGMFATPPKVALHLLLVLFMHFVPGWSTATCFKCFRRTCFTIDMLRPILGLVVAIGGKIIQNITASCLLIAIIAFGLWKNG